ncbi:MAG: hypothetical protein R2753_16350 [Chitinophagales bacterium]
MSKLGRKARVKQKLEEQNGKKVLLYLAIGLLVAAVVIGIFVV